MLARSGRLNGLGVVRVSLVIAILLFQSAEVSQSFQQIFSTALWVVPALALPALFAAMGFSWAMSREPREARAFLVARGRRCGPLFVAVITLTALALGPLVTTETLRRYFADPDTWLYFANIAGWPRLNLPGVFEFNDLSQTVNPVVWAVPPFILLAMLVAFAPAARAHLLYGTLILLLAILPILADLSGLVSIPGGQLGVLVIKSVFCLMCGLSGAFAYRVRNNVPIDWRIAIAAAGWLILIAVGGNAEWSRTSWLPAIALLPLMTLVLHASAGNLAGRRLASHAQPYLMPALLLSFPVQQAVLALGPENQSLSINAAYALPAIMIGAFAIHQALRLTRLTLPVSDEFHDDPGPTWRRREARRLSPAQRVRTALLNMFLAVILTGLGFAVLALTYFALQRDAVGI